jgi:glutaredoxin-like protein
MFRMYGLDLERVEEKLSHLKSDVKLVFFSREAHCNHCQEAQRLYERLAAITHKLIFEHYNYAINKEKDEEFNIFAVPALALIGEKDYKIRYYGYPQGIELNNFLDDIIYVSRGESNLQEGTLRKLLKLDKDVQLKIFFTPTCVYSLPTVKMGIKLAIASNTIFVNIIDAQKFLEVAEKYGVEGIPMTVVNEKHEFYGTIDEEKYLEKIIELA